MRSVRAAIRSTASAQALASQTSTCSAPIALPASRAGGDDFRRGLRVVAIEERDVGAFVGEKLDDRAADAAAAAGDDRDLAGQPGIDFHRRLIPRCRIRRRRPAYGR